VELIPYVPIATNLRSGVSIFSYCDQLTFGITGDYATTPGRRSGAVICLLASGIILRSQDEWRGTGLWI
jgi:hypothetical protein